MVGRRSSPESRRAMPRPRCRASRHCWRKRSSARPVARAGTPDWIWFGEGAGPRAARALLRPAELLYSAAVAVRGAMYDRGVLRVEPPAVPVLSIGNMTVGGTGKTPVAAWA